MLFIWYPKCTTCVRAKRWLDANGLSYTTRHIKDDNPSRTELREFWKQSGLPLRKFFNTSGTLYRSLSLKERLPSMSDEEMIELLSSDGMLVKRPIVVTDDGRILLGFNENTYSTLLKE